MLLATVAETSARVAATGSRLAKRAELATLLRAAEPDEIDIVVAYLAGELRQRRTGIGWSALRSVPPPAGAPSLVLLDVDAALERIAALAGPGSGTARARAVAELFAAATESEQDFLRRLISGALRQGALDSAVLDALAVASGVPLEQVRRAVMLAGATGPVAVAALTGGADAVAGFGLQIGRPVRPMLASSAPDVAVALDRIGDAAVVDTKLDGIRIQAHRDAGEVRLFTRSLDDITDRLPEVVATVRGLPAERFVLDGEVMTLDERGRARPFQDTASRAATRTVGTDGSASMSTTEPEGTAPVSTAGTRESAPISAAEAERVLPSRAPADRTTAFFFDLLAVDDVVLLDEPLTERLRRLDALVPPEHRVERRQTDDADAAADFAAAALAAGHEGVVVKDPASGYEAGRRGASWIKVKPRHTLDLVVLAVEWGSGRRRGWLSNIHLGARDPERGRFVMLGKTFKGMTDEMLAWQTERFRELAAGPVDESRYVVPLRPEQVVEIAFDGVQRSTRYPGGVALRFARVLRYRDDKSAADADTIDAVRALAAGPR